MKKQRLISLLLICLVCILPILCILMVHHVTLCNTMQKMEGGIFGETTCLFSLSKNNTMVRENLFDVVKEQGNSVAIYLDDKSDTKNVVRYMAFTDEYITLPMVEGRFLKSDDFEKGNDIAVVGKNVEGLYDSNGHKCIQVNDKEYQVVGIFGYEEDTEFDNYIFLNLFSCDDETLKIYIFDIFSEKGEEQLIEKCEKSMASIDCEMKTLSVEEKFQDTIKISFDFVSYFIGLLSCYVLCIILISYQWVMFQRRELGIRRLLGASKNQITFFLLGRYFIYMAISFGVGVSYCKILYPSYIVSFYKGYGISAIILIVFMIGLIIKLRNDSIEEVIKR